MNRRQVCVFLVLIMAASVMAQGKGKGRGGAKAQGVIDDPYAVSFSDTHIRSSADRLAQNYDLAVSLVNRWNALGGDQFALDSMRDDLRRAADFIGYTNHERVGRTNKAWGAHLSLTGLPPIPNTNDVIDDGKIQSITGVDANNLETRCQEFLTWLDTGAFEPPDPTSGGGGAWLFTILDVGYISGRDPDLNSAQLFVSRLNELIADYEANSNAKLNTILIVAINVEVVP